MEIQDWSMLPPTQAGYYWVMSDSFRALPRMVEVRKAAGFPSPECRLETYSFPPDSLIVLEMGDCEPYPLSGYEFYWWSTAVTVDYISPMDLWRLKVRGTSDLPIQPTEVEYNSGLVERLLAEDVSLKAKGNDYSSVEI